MGALEDQLNASDRSRSLQLEIDNQKLRSQLEEIDNGWDFLLFISLKKGRADNYFQNSDTLILKI